MGDASRPPLTWAHGILEFLQLFGLLQRMENSFLSLQRQIPELYTTSLPWGAIMHISMSLTRKGCAAAIPQGSHTGVEGEILLQELGIGMAEMLHFCSWACAVPVLSQRTGRNAPECGSCQDFCGEAALVPLEESAASFICRTNEPS